MSNKRYYNVKVALSPAGDIDDVVDAVCSQRGAIAFEWEQENDD